MKAHRRELIDPKVNKHRGRIVKTTGDGKSVDRRGDIGGVQGVAGFERHGLGQVGGIERLLGRKLNRGDGAAFQLRHLRAGGGNQKDERRKK